MAATTADGQVIIIEDNSPKQTIDNPFGTEDVHNISSIKEFSKGFFLSSDKGHISMWVRSEENNQSTNKENQIFDFIRSWHLSKVEMPSVISMDVNLSEEYIVSACRNNNIYITHIKSIGLNESMDKEVKVDQIAKGFHSGPVDAIDCAVQRPLIVTLSREDSTIRIWNYYKNTCEQAKLYSGADDAPLNKTTRPLLSVAIHPAGYYLAVGFQDRIRLFHILHNGTRSFRQIDIRNCSKIKFSNGGQWFAATDSKHLYLYNSYTLQRIGPPEKLPSGNVTKI
jgi:cilia- and flagella-associated protein 57